MTFGIPRVHGTIIAPKNFAGVGLQDFTLQFYTGDKAAVYADYNVSVTASTGLANTLNVMGTPNGALDQIFRTAVETIGTVSRIGTLNTATSTATINFALETLGVDQYSADYLGTGPTDSVSGQTTGTQAAVAATIQSAVQALGSLSFWVNTGTTGASYQTVSCSSATVVAFTY